jgi:eukaryotic translation initiation factor 2C
MPDNMRLKLQKFIYGMRVMARPAGSSGPPIGRTIKKISSAGADRLTFRLREGEIITVAEYYRRQNQQLQFPRLLCVEVNNPYVRKFGCCSPI